MDIGRTEKELIDLIRLGKRTGDMKLRNMARAALFALQSDDGTPGLGYYLWENYVTPNLLNARKRARWLVRYRKERDAVVNTARALSRKRICARGVGL